MKSALGCAVLAALFCARPAPALESASFPTVTAGTDSLRSSGAGTAGGDAVAGPQASDSRPEMVEPLFVRLLEPVGSGRNDVNPRWSPRGTFLSFERSMGDKKEIRISLADGTPIQTIYHLLSGGGPETGFILPGIAEDISYNAGIAWSPDEQRFIFMSNGGEGNYDLYYQTLGGTAVTRLTDHREKDGQAHWSPVAARIIFVSGRSGSGDVYLLDIPTCSLTQLTGGRPGTSRLYPRWSPDGRKVVYMEGSSENHDIVLLGDVSDPVRSRRQLTSWPHDDLRPVWSPDGKWIAFYSNYNPAGDPRIWSLMVVAADGSDPQEGDGLAARVTAADVIPDVETGPAWLPDSGRIVFVKNDRREYNPLYIADVRTRTISPIRTDTRMNHDVACSPDGTIAFRAQVNQWDQIYTMKLHP